MFNNATIQGLELACASGNLCPYHEEGKPVTDRKFRCALCARCVHGLECSDGVYISKHIHQQSMYTVIHCKLCVAELSQHGRAVCEPVKCSRKACKLMQSERKIPCYYNGKVGQSHPDAFLHAKCYQKLVLDKHQTVHPDPSQRKLVPDDWIDIACSKNCQEKYTAEMVRFSNPKYKPPMDKDGPNSPNDPINTVTVILD